MLADESEFEFELNTSSFFSDSFENSALLTVTLVNDGWLIDNICSAAAGGTNLAFDDNGDGVVNSDDVSFAIQAAGSLRGDLDFDGSVGFADFLILSNNFGATDTVYTTGDLTCDGAVAFADFLVLSGNFGESFASSAASVPEPNADMLLLAAVLLASVRINRRRL